MDLSERQCQFTSALARLILKAEELGYAVKIQELNRDLETQKRYVAEGKSKTLNSRHLDKLAADLVLFKDGMAMAGGPEFKPLGEWWEKQGGVWGGRWASLADDCHFEMPMPKT